MRLTPEQIERIVPVSDRVCGEVARRFGAEVELIRGPVLLKVLANCEAQEVFRNLEGFVYRTAQREAQRSLRRERTLLAAARQREPDRQRAKRSAREPLTDLLRNEERELLTRAVQSLPPRQQQAVRASMDGELALLWQRGRFKKSQVYVDRRRAFTAIQRRLSI